MLSRSLLIVVVLAAGRALAQDSGPDFDASLPDGSVGNGGADQPQEADDGTGNTVCTTTRDCERGFTCNNGHCTYAPFKVASCQGCGGGETAVMVFPLVLVWRWRRRRGE